MEWNGVTHTHTHTAVLKTVPHCKQFSSSRSLRHTSRTPAMQPPWRGWRGRLSAPVGARSASQASHVSSLKRETLSDGGSEANKSMRPQKKRRGDQALPDYKGMTWCIYLWGQKPKIITDALVLGESLKESGTRAHMVACVAPDTHEVLMSVHLDRFWEVMPV